MIHMIFEASIQFHRLVSNEDQIILWHSENDVMNVRRNIINFMEMYVETTGCHTVAKVIEHNSNILHTVQRTHFVAHFNDLDWIAFTEIEFLGLLYFHFRVLQHPFGSILKWMPIGNNTLSCMLCMF